MRDGDSSEEEEYDENVDEDFAPDGTNADEDQSSSSDDESEGTIRVARKSKKRPSETLEEPLDSGDEATIKEQKRRKRKKARDDGEDSAGEGSLIMTRSQRLAAKIEKKERRRAATGDVTIDVNQMWAELNSIPIGRTTLPILKQENETTDLADGREKENIASSSNDQMITIKRRIEFAGEISEVEERVPRTSKAAQEYLREHPDADANHQDRHIGTSGLQRPLKRPSMFEPNPLGAVKGVPMEKLRPRAPSRVDVLMAQMRAEESQRKKAQKMTTVQKSALDWKGFVDQGGFRQELDEYGKSSKAFLAREAFLDGAAGAREQAARDARLKL